MFKRIEKKLVKKKKEEELGLTEEIKEAIGLGDLDSDDSSSDESEASSSTSNSPVPSKRKRLLDDELDTNSDAGSEGQGATDDQDDDDEPGIQMTVEEALHNPLYIISIQPDIRGCIICSRKLLKNDTMVSVHMSSQAHQRRMSKFKQAAVSVKLNSDAQDVLSAALASAVQPKQISDGSAPVSNRAAKRIAKFEKMKAKRQKHKVGKARSITAKAAKKLEKKEGSESELNDVVQTVKPQKKKPKLQPPSSPGKRTPLSTKQKPDDQLDGDPQRRRPGSIGALAVDKTNPKSKPREKGKKRKERN